MLLHTTSCQKRRQERSRPWRRQSWRIPPTIPDIPPKTCTVGPSSVLWAPTTTLDPIFSINNLSPKRNLLLHISPSVHLSLDKIGDQSRGQCKNIIYPYHRWFSKSNFVRYFVFISCDPLNKSRFDLWVHVNAIGWCILPLTEKQLWYEHKVQQISPPPPSFFCSLDC